MKVVNPAPKILPGKRKISKSKDSKWYSAERSKPKRRLQGMAKTLQRRPKDPCARNSFFQVKKEYRKTVEKAKRAHEVDANKILESKAMTQKIFGSI